MCKLSLTPFHHHHQSKTKNHHTTSTSTSPWHLPLHLSTNNFPFQWQCTKILDLLHHDNAFVLCIIRSTCHTHTYCSLALSVSPANLLILSTRLLQIAPHIDFATILSRVAMRAIFCRSFKLKSVDGKNKLSATQSKRKLCNNTNDRTPPVGSPTV